MGDRSERFPNYDKRLISILEILGSYFTDIYFNYVYRSAKTNAKSSASLTDEYVRRVQAYLIGVKNDKQCYQDTITHIHKYFQTNTRFRTLTFVEFVNRIVSQFIPEEYYKIMRDGDKDETLGNVITDLASALGTAVTKPAMLRSIIDDHDAKYRVTIDGIQHHAVTILLSKRAGLYNKFLQKMSQAKDTVSMDVVENMKNIIKKHAKEKADLLSRLHIQQNIVNDSKSVIASLEKRAKEFQKREQKYKKLIVLLKEQATGGKSHAAIRSASDRIPRVETLAENAGRGAHKMRPVVPRETLAEGSFFAPPINESGHRKSKKDTVRAATNANDEKSNEESGAEEESADESDTEEGSADEEPNVDDVPQERSVRRFTIDEKMFD